MPSSASGLPIPKSRGLKGIRNTGAEVGLHNSSKASRSVRWVNTRGSIESNGDDDFDYNVDFDVDTGTVAFTESYGVVFKVHLSQKASKRGVASKKPSASDGQTWPIP
jgi:hypothetical protein